MKCKNCGHDKVYSETGVCCAEKDCECTQDLENDRP